MCYRFICALCTLLRICAIDPSKTGGHSTLSLEVGASGSVSGPAWIRRSSDERSEVIPAESTPDDDGDAEAAKVFKPQETGSEEAPSWCVGALEAVTQLASGKKSFVEVSLDGLPSDMDEQSPSASVHPGEALQSSNHTTPSTKSGGAVKQLLKMINRELPVELDRIVQLIGWSLAFKIATVTIFITLPAFIFGVLCSCILPFKYCAYVKRQNERVRRGLKPTEPLRLSLEWLWLHRRKLGLAAGCFLATAAALTLLLLWQELMILANNFHPKPLEQFVVQTFAEIAQVLEETGRRDDWAHFSCQLLMTGKSLQTVTVENAADMPLEVSSIKGNVLLDGLTVFAIQGRWPTIPARGEGECEMVLKASKAGISWNLLGISFKAFAQARHFLVVGFDLEIDGNFGDRNFHVRTLIDLPCELDEAIFRFDGQSIDADADLIVGKIAECIPKGLKKFRDGLPEKYMLHWRKTEFSGYYVDLCMALLVVLGMIGFFLVALCTGRLVQAADARHNLLPKPPPIRTSPSVTSPSEGTDPHPQG